MVTDTPILRIRDLRSGRTQLLTADEVSILMLALADVVSDYAEDLSGRDDAPATLLLKKFKYVTGLKDANIQQATS